jgi:glucose-1-phosphate adenylyltransferase
MKDTSTRFVSRLTHNTLALVLAGGRGTRLGVLTEWRTKPAVPFGGKFRIIDFTLSNCLNSNIRKIAVLTQYKSHSLIQHLLQGWNRFNTELGEFVDLVPAQQWVDDEHWYQGTADAVFQTLDIIESYNPHYVLILAGDHVYTMDYGEMLATHADAGADLTIACNPVPLEAAKQFGVMAIEKGGRITEFEEKPDKPTPLPDDPDRALASMGIYVFSVDYLREQLTRDAEDNNSSHDFGKDVIPHALKQGHHVQAHRFSDASAAGGAYWRDVGTVDAFFQANMEIISPDPPLDIYDPAWPIMTHQPQLPPAHFVGDGSRCIVTNSMVSGGCAIHESNLANSLLFSNVRVHDGCELSGVVALPGCEIGAGSRLTNVILDNLCHVPEGTVIGDDPAMDAERFEVSEGGVTVVNRVMLGQGSHYMPGIPVEPAATS